MQSVAAIHLSNASRSFGSVPGFSKLFRTYCEQFQDVSRFYAADYRSIEAIPDEFGRINDFARDRDHLVETLLAQNESWGIDSATAKNIESLRDPESVAVVTGQQVGLLGGPLYTIYKTATAIKLAKKLSEISRKPVIPVFWLEGEDHDLDEVRTVHLLRTNEAVELSYEVPTPEPRSNYGPVGRIKLTDEISKLIDEVDRTLPPTDFKPELMRTILDAYRPGVTLRTAFARLLKSFFPSDGLVFISPDDRRFKSTAVSLFKKEVDDCRAMADAIQVASDELAAEYHAQVSVRPTNLFLINERGRFAIDADADGGFSVRGQDQRFTRDELIALIEDDPCSISPNVVLRPILQDRILPTVAYVGGPGEIAYFAQLKPAYDWSGEPMPVIFPRASVTIVETKVQKILDDYRLDVGGAGENVDELFRKVVIEKMDVDLGAAFASAASHLHEGVNAVKVVATSVDGTMGKAVEAARASILKEWKRLEEKVLKAEKRQHDEDRDRLTRLKENLYPSGVLQERGLSILYFLNKYGPGFVTELVESISLDTGEHQVLTIHPGPQ